MIVLTPVVCYVRDGKTVRAANLISTEAGRAGREELVDFAQRIGIKEEWLANRATVHEHFDLRGARIERALQQGVGRIDNRALERILKKKREQLGLVRVSRKLIQARSAMRRFVPESSS